MDVNWKEVTRQLCDQHNKWQAGLVPLSPDGVIRASGGSLVQVTEDEDLLEVPRTELRPKEVRSWLWKTMRKKRAVARRRAVLCSVVKDNKSYAWVGATTTPKVAQKYEGEDD